MFCALRAPKVICIPTIYIYAHTPFLDRGNSYLLVGCVQRDLFTPATNFVIKSVVVTQVRHFPHNNVGGQGKINKKRSTTLSLMAGWFYPKMIQWRLKHWKQNFLYIFQSVTFFCCVVYSSHDCVTSRDYKTALSVCYYIVCGIQLSRWVLSWRL